MQSEKNSGGARIGLILPVTLELVQALPLGVAFRPGNAISDRTQRTNPAAPGAGRGRVSSEEGYERSDRHWNDRIQVHGQGAHQRLPAGGPLFRSTGETPS